MWSDLIWGGLLGFDATRLGSIQFHLFGSKLFQCWSIWFESGLCGSIRFDLPWLGSVSFGDFLWKHQCMFAFTICIDSWFLTPASYRTLGSQLQWWQLGLCWYGQLWSQSLIFRRLFSNSLGVQSFSFMNCLTGGFCGHQSFWSHPETSGVIRSHLESSGATWSCLDLSGASGAFWNYLELSGVIWSHLELSRAIWTYLEASGAFWSQGSHLEPSEDIWRHLEPSGGIWYHLESTVAISSYLDPSESCHRGGVTICCHLVWFDVIWFVLSWVDSSWFGLRCFH